VIAPINESRTNKEIIEQTIALNELESSKFRRIYTNEQITTALERIIESRKLTDMRHIKANAAALMLKAFENNGAAKEIKAIDDVKTEPIIMPGKTIEKNLSNP